MTLKDTMVLVASKLRVRRRRTIATIITASVLFGIIATVLFVAKGLQNNLARAAQTNSGKEVIMVVRSISNLANSPEAEAKALELYDQSDDPNKKSPVIEEFVDESYTYTYLDTENPFTLAAFAFLHKEGHQAAITRLNEIVEEYHGKVISSEEVYALTADTLFIDGLTKEEPMPDGTISYSGPGEIFNVVNRDVLAPFIKLTEQKDDVIQVLAPLDYAAKVMGISVPTYRTSAYAKFREYVNTVNERAIGHRFTGIATTTDGQEREITYEIVGLLPPTSTNLFNRNYGIGPDTADPVKLLVKSLDGTNGGKGLMVTNPGSTAFRSNYGSGADNYMIKTNDILASFGNIEDAADFNERYGTGTGSTTTYEYMGSQLILRNGFALINRAISIFLLIFSFVAMIIMAGTVNRVIDDERQTIALYRAVGASTKDIVQVFTAYIFTLVLFVIVSATVTGLVLSGVLTAINTSLVTAFISLSYNLPNLAPTIFIGFGPQLLVVCLAVITVGLICLLLVQRKLHSKNIVKDLRK
jgi:ABC-type lipoprotein release transport system permease subunit